MEEVDTIPPQIIVFNKIRCPIAGKVNNILIVSDSCYSGMLAKSRSIWKMDTSDRRRYLMTMLETPSRILIASGGDKPVPDSFGGRHSLFAKAFVDGLRTANRNTFTLNELFIFC
jgi:hypothetical protein